MPEYKDVTELKKQISDFKRMVQSPNSDYLTGYVCALSVTEGMIAGIPTADVVEVVRCKDCRCFMPIILNGKVQERGYCTLGCDWVNRKETDFCNYGKRKEVANNG